MPDFAVKYFWASLLYLAFAIGSHAHVDAVRVSLAQLFLQAELVALAHIDSVAERNLSEVDRPELLEVVTATVIEQFKGPSTMKLDFFLDAHGPAHYQPGDTVVLFLEKPGSGHPLVRYVEKGKLDYLSQQVRTTEHIVEDSSRPDYLWVLARYSDALPGVNSNPPASGMASTLLRMLQSDAPALVESALLDWQTAGAQLQFNEDQVRALLEVTREVDRPLNLRLAILRSMAQQRLVGPEAWDALFNRAAAADLVPVIRSTQGYENAYFEPTLRKLLGSADEDIAGAAARALGHPAYRGSESALGKLLDSDSRRLNYAAVAGLAGINSPQGLAILRETGRNHPDERVRRLIDAKLKTANGESGL